MIKEKLFFRREREVGETRARSPHFFFERESMTSEAGKENNKNHHE